MNVTHQEICGKCSAEIDPNRRVDFTLQDGTRVCDACFVKGTPRPNQAGNDWPSWVRQELGSLSNSNKH